jgi:hypothetical protein
MAADVFKNLAGTIYSKFRLGLGGPWLKNAAGTVEVRAPSDSAYAAVASALFKTYGNDFELNSGASGSGSDWVMTFRRPSTGMTHNLIVVFPPNDPAPGQVLGASSLVGDVLTLAWLTVDGGADKVVVDTTDLEFGATSPVTLFTTPPGAVVLSVRVVVDTPFNGSPSLSVGIASAPSKYLPSTAVDLTAQAATTFDYEPGLPAASGSEALIATYSANGASAGAARILVSYVVPN